MITFKSHSGVGINAIYSVMRDSKRIATLQRNGNRGWRCYSAHYGEALFSGRNIDAIKQMALAFIFPDKREVYERICKRVESQRRAHKESANARDLARLSRELVGGSNSARVELERLLSEIDAWIADRTDTHAAARARIEAGNKEEDRYSGKWSFAPSPGTYPYYPEPPNEEHERGAAIHEKEAV